MKKVTSLILAIMLVFSFTFIIACNTDTSHNSTTPSSQSSIWNSATYQENTELGNGTKVISVEIKAEDKSVTLTVKTDCETLGEALKEHSLIQGENGLYTVVNGMTADWNVDKTYWALTENGVMCMEGADTLEISDGGHYEWTKTK